MWSMNVMEKYGWEIIKPTRCLLLMWPGELKLTVNRLMLMQQRRTNVWDRLSKGVNFFFIRPGEVVQLDWQK